MPQETSGKKWPLVMGAAICSLFVGGCTERENASRQALSDVDPDSTPRELYVAYCGACHGADGRGDGPLAAELKQVPINLRTLKQDNDGIFPMQRIQRSIDGRAMPRAHGLPEMPVWGRTWILEGLSEAQVQARSIVIAGYISSIQD